MKTSQPLWDYACTLYDKTAVQRACMALQDDYGLNTPLLLFACWQLELNGCIEQDVLREAIQLVDVIDKPVITPMRHVRRAIKTESIFAKAQWQTLYKELAAIELKTERLLLEALEALSADSKEGGICSLQALVSQAYPHVLTAPADATIVEQHLAVLDQASAYD